MSQIYDYKRLFDYGSLLPLIQFILGVYILFLIINQDNSMAFLIMLAAFVIYIINNIIINIKEGTTVFNEYLEDMSSFLTFNITIVVFGTVFFKDDLLVLTVLFFFSICQLLAIARNWVLGVKNSKGWPIPLNGLFFPLTYFIYLFYLQGPGDSIFLLYYVIVAVLSVSEYNFLGYEEKVEENNHGSQDRKIEKASMTYNSDREYVQNKISERLEKILPEEKHSISEKKGMIKLMFGKY